MNTIVYLMRHSEVLKMNKDTVNVSDEPLIANKTGPLSVRGEEMAKYYSTFAEFRNLDEVYCSEYARTSCTAKYFADVNDKLLNVDERLGERIHGFTNESRAKEIKIPEDYAIKQIEDENFRFLKGESRKEVFTRFNECMKKILNDNKGKRICVVSHGTAMMFYLMQWCEVKYQEYFKFRDRIIFDGKWGYLETFKLEFDDDNNIVSIEIIYHHKDFEKKIIEN